MTKVLRKTVNVFPKSPIIGLGVPLSRSALGISLSIGDIKVCLYRGAKVEEVIRKGLTIPLNFSNYDKDNSGAVDETKVAEIKTEVKDTENVVSVKQKPEVKPYVPTSNAPVNNSTTSTTGDTQKPEAGKPVVETENTTKKETATVTAEVKQANKDEIAKAQEKINAAVKKSK